MWLRIIIQQEGAAVVPCLAAYRRYPFTGQLLPLDLFIGRQGLELVGNIAACAISFLIFYMMGIIDWPVDYPLFLIGFFT